MIFICTYDPFGKGLLQNMRNMLSYINTGATNDEATEVIDNEVKEARLKEEWKAEYMLTLVHDKDVYRDGYDEGAESRQAEVDALNIALKEKDAELEKFKSLLLANGIEIDK